MANNTFMILGCGHSESLDHYNNNAAVLNDQGTLIIDCGHTIKHALHAQSMTIADIDAIFITHVHGDHAYGLERVAYEAMFKYKKRIKLIFHESIYEELWHQTLKGSLGKIGEGETQLEDFFDVEILTQNQFHIFGNDYQIFNVRHTENKATFGVNINKEIFYSSDTTAIPDIIAAQTFHTGFHDVTLTDSNPVHAPLSNLIEQYPETIRQTLYLMSYEDNWRDYQSTVEREFKGFATQGMKIHF